MAKTHPSWTVDTTFSAKNIASAASVYAFTAAEDARVSFTVKLTNAAGGGDYIVYLTHDWLGGSAAATVLPKSTCTAAAGETKIEFVTIQIDVKATDVINVMVDGLAGDTSVNGAIRIVADNPSVFQATDTVSTVTTLTNMPAAAPNVSAIGTEIWAGTYTRQINSVTGTISANVVQIDGETTPVDNLVLALGNSSGVMISNAAVDAVWDEAISGHLTAGTTGAKLNTASSGSGSGSTAYTNTVTDDSSNPLDGVEVWITSDVTGASTVASTTTNTLGSFTVYLDPGTYYLWLAKGGYNFPNPTTITVS